MACPHEVVSAAVSSGLGGEALFEELNAVVLASSVDEEDPEVLGRVERLDGCRHAAAESLLGLAVGPKPEVIQRQVILDLGDEGVFESGFSEEQPLQEGDRVGAMARPLARLGSALI